MSNELVVNGSGLLEILETIKILPDPAKVHEQVLNLRASNPAASPKQLSDQVVRSTVLRCTGIGAVAGLPAVIPGFGTGAQIAADLGIAGGEFAILMRNTVQMQYTVAGLYGHDLHAPERKEELLIIVGLEAGAVIPAAEAGTRLGTKVAVSQFNKRVSGSAIRKVNQKLGTTVFTKWGAKRGGVALGRLIPFGVGVAVGGTVNYFGTRAFGSQILKYYSEIQPRDAEIFIPAD